MCKCAMQTNYIDLHGSEVDNLRFPTHSCTYTWQIIDILPSCICCKLPEVCLTNFWLTHEQNFQRQISICLLAFPVTEIYCARWATNLNYEGHTRSKFTKQYLHGCTVSRQRANLLIGVWYFGMTLAKKNLYYFPKISIIICNVYTQIHSFGLVIRNF